MCTLTIFKAAYSRRISKNQQESEDGGGGWHQHVSIRSRHNSAGNLSKHRMSISEIRSSSSSASSGTDSQSSDESSSSSGSDHIIGARGQNKFLKGSSTKITTSEIETAASFQEKKQRLQNVLFGAKEFPKDDEIPIKGMHLPVYKLL